MIKTIEFVPIKYSKEQFKKQNDYKDIKKKINSIQKVLSIGHYFSYSYILT